MNLADELLEEIEPVYAEIQELKNQLIQLNHLEKARTEYEQLFTNEDNLLASLENKRRRLDIDFRSLTTLKREIKPIIPLPKSQKLWQKNEQTIEFLPHDTNSNKPTDKKIEVDIRENFKRQIQRFYGSKLGESLGEINRIADDISRPLGEALALLDWNIFQDYAIKNANNTSKLEVLKEWGQELQEYSKQLSYDVKMQQDRFHPYLNICELWQKRQESTESKQNWEMFIEKTRQAKQTQIDIKEEEIRQLEEKIAQIKTVNSQSER